ncbi:uncharacterized protein LOC123910610 [Trifolium pratense]|nr:uncharacterized protein LOC123910610 [Trifolium pratense]
MKEEEESTVKMEWLTSIDSTTLSHSELQTLSLSSLSSFDLKSTRQIVTPKIDPSTFNHSAGSHRQTYSRSHRRCRAPPLLPTPVLPSDHRIIIDYLKQFIREDPKFDQVELLQPVVVPSISPPVVFSGEVRKRKRGRKPKMKVHLDECYRGMEIVNKNGVAVDLNVLSMVEHPFAAEIARRTEGLSKEEELLEFLSDLVGQWGSRRRKRRIVDAADFGDVLPLGWKLLLSLKRKDGRAWIYCRRYISPSGQQFVSCKEVSSYLQSRFGHSDLQLQISHRSESILQEQRVTTENSTGVAHEEQDQRQIVATNSDVSGLSVSNERLKEMSLLEMENLADVQIHDLFECHKCNMTFGEKDAYLEHLLSIHQKTTRRYRLGSSVSDGVIIKDGKFECQFCHKVFLEKRRYNSHVGIHVRNYLRKAEDLPDQPNVSRAEESPVTDEMPSKISKMDALIEIAQNSIVEDSVMEPSSSKLNTIHASEIAAGDLDEDINVESLVSEQQMEESLIGPNVVHDLNRQVSPHLPMGGTIEKIDNDNRVINAKIYSFLDNTSLLSVNNKNVDAPDTSKGKGGAAPTVDGFDHSGIDLQGISQIPLLPSFGNHMTPGYEKSENSGCTNTKGDLKLDENNSNKSDLKIGLDGCKDVPGVANVQVTAMPTSKENVIQSMVSNPSVSPEQSMDSFSAFSSDKGFQELRLEDIGSLEYDFASVQDVSAELANNIVVQGTCASQEVMLNLGANNQLTTTCVWCGIEFNHDAVNSEIQSDSVGFMCPVCKAKISGQINVLDTGSPNAGHL